MHVRINKQATVKICTQVLKVIQLQSSPTFRHLLCSPFPLVPVSSTRLNFFLRRKEPNSINCSRFHSTNNTQQTEREYFFSKAVLNQFLSNTHTNTTTPHTSPWIEVLLLAAVLPFKWLPHQSVSLSMDAMLRLIVCGCWPVVISVALLVYVRKYVCMCCPAVESTWILFNSTRNTRTCCVYVCVQACLCIKTTVALASLGIYISMYVCIHTNKQSYIYVHILQNVYPVAQWCRMPNCKLMSYCPSARMYSISNI